MNGIPVEAWINENKNDPEFMAEFERQRPWYELQRSIIQARKKAGLTQAEIAQAMNTTKSAISRLENAETLPNLKTLTRLAAVLGCHLEVKLIANQ